MYGSLTLLCGPMFSGKTTESLKRILWAKNGQGRRVQVFKPAFDTRYAKTALVNHDGLRAEAENISTWIGIAPGTEMVFFDEVQFFTEPHFNGKVTDIIEELLSQGIDVVAAGLDMDFKGKPFATTAHLAAMADEIVKLKAICSVCGRPAGKSYRLSGGQDKVELGGADKYQARCTRHWAEPDSTTELFGGKMAS